VPQLIRLLLSFVHSVFLSSVLPNIAVERIPAKLGLLLIVPVVVAVIAHFYVIGLSTLALRPFTLLRWRLADSLVIIGLLRQYERRS
jgi:hypothetical protein